MSLMGVDVGTTGVKAVVLNESGRVLSSAYSEYALIFPFANAAELDSQAVMDAACSVIASAAKEVSHIDPVKAIGIASQGEAFTPIARDGRILGNAMISSDSRAAYIAQPWSEAFGIDRLYEITGHTAHPMLSIFKFLWLKEHNPEIWRDAWKFLFVADLLAFVLTGETVTDYSLASRSMLFDVRKKVWSEEILAEIELSVDKLPRAVESGGIAGRILSCQAEKLGLEKEVTVVLGGHDQPVGALGCGAAGEGLAAYSIGTVECICPATSKAILSSELMKSNLATYPHVLPDTYTTVAFNLTGGTVLKWIRDNFAIEEAARAKAAGQDVYEAIIASASMKPSDLIFLPHFGPTGTPHFDLNGAGTLFGLKLSTGRDEIIRAVLEGITYEMKLNLAILADSGFTVRQLRAVGGGAKSDIWMQIKADILGIPLTTIQISEGTCVGAAILAGSGTGVFSAQETSLAWAVPIKTFEPNAQNAFLYDERFAIYQDVFESLSGARKQLGLLKGA